MADVSWSTRAMNDLGRITDYIEMFDVTAALRLRSRLESLGDSLTQFPHRGRLAVRGTREIVVVRPYILRYQVLGDQVLILGIRHGARLSDNGDDR